MLYDEEETMNFEPEPGDDIGDDGIMGPEIEPGVEPISPAGDEDELDPPETELEN